MYWQQEVAVIFCGAMKTLNVELFQDVSASMIMRKLCANKATLSMLARLGQNGVRPSVFIVQSKSGQNDWLLFNVGIIKIHSRMSDVWVCEFNIH